ncbi:hypothetical protein MNBD_GAMMA08-1363 [hydrothermal vent metagenome]|uniref:LysM domain-containing protein n=1 Tax=hydrothermal vent metagenome TaxID=652676 RepID=A0A3B0XUP4_9ZZZZ
MKRFVILLLSAALISFFCSRANAQPSNRVQVYAISQSYWDVTPGETLGDIVKQLLPDNMGLRKKLQSKIIELNPNAFSRSNPDNLKANVRLWLPNNAPAMQQVKNKKKYDVKSFSWGQMYKPKR